MNDPPRDLESSPCCECGYDCPMGRVLIILAIVMLTIYCVVEVAQAHPTRVRAMPKWLWAFVVIAIPVIGPVTWLLAGRPQSVQGRRRSLGPDDDEDFLRGLR